MDLQHRSRRFVAALGTEAAAAHLAPRLVYDMPGLATLRGRRDVAAFLAAMRRNVPGLRHRVLSVHEAGDGTVVRWAARAGGRDLGRGVHFLQWSPEGQVARAEVYSDPDLLRETTRVQDAPRFPRPRQGATMARLRHRRQETDYTCGPAALGMVLDAFGLAASEPELAAALGTEPRVGTRQRAIERALKAAGLRTRLRHTTATTVAIRDALRKGSAVLVCYWLEDEATDHYAVVRRIGPDAIALADPWSGPQATMPLAEFERVWRGDPNVHTRRDRWMLEVRRPTARTASKATPHALATQAAAEPEAMAA